MSWQEEYHKALAGVLVREGSLVRENPSMYSWSEWDDHTDECGVAKIWNVREDEWQEFKGTFYPGDHWSHGIACEFACMCGQLNGRTLRYEGSVSDLIKAVTMAFPEEIEL